LKHAEECNKLIIKQEFFALSLSIAKMFSKFDLPYLAIPGHVDDGIFHWDDCCFVTGAYIKIKLLHVWSINTKQAFISCYDLREELSVVYSLI
jgi:hypothetical protein